MARHFITTASMAAIAIAAAGSASAADLDQIIYSPQVNRTVPVEIGNGWYLRGDIGYSFETDGEDADGLTASELDSEWSGGIGVGYQFTDFFRGDLTADYSEGEFDGSAGAISGTSDLETIGLMANAYIDLGTFVGITPYIGAGAGVTRTEFGPADLSPAGIGTIDGETDWRFTYALMAGASYDLTSNLKLDVGYRFTDVAGGDLYSGEILGAAVDGDDDGFTKHEVRAGLRYMLW